MRAGGRAGILVAAFRSAGPPVRLTAILLLSACQPEARRLLLLDLALADPVVLNSTAQPWRDAGYTVEYRRFYPHLTWADLARYRTLVFLLGREPQAPSDALGAGDLALLNEWVRRGGFAVLGYDGDGEGDLDRWTANQWLASRGAGIVVGEHVLEDITAQAWTTGRPPPWAVARPVGAEPLGSVYDPFPLDRNHAVVTRHRAQVLAITSSHAFVRTPQGAAARSDACIAAAVRLGDGLVVVISRHALGALGAQYRPSQMPLPPADDLMRTHDFLTALARWSRRPAGWAHVPPAAHGVPLGLQQAPLPVELRPPRLAPPAGAGTVELPLAPDEKLVRGTNVPGWLRRQGMRVLWLPLFATRDGRRAPRSRAVLDSLVTFLDIGGLNVLAGDAAPQWADSSRARWDQRDAVRRAWSDAVKGLGPTSVGWIPAFDLADARLPPADSSRGTRGEGLPAPCVLDSALWTAGLGSAYTTLGRLAGDERTLVIAVGLDLGGERGPGPDGRGYEYTMGQEFCDAAWRQALTRIARRGEFDALPYGERYRTLREAGLLPLYYRALEDLVAERAAALRDRVLRQRRDLSFAFRLPQAPADWFSHGLLRGFGLPNRPLLLFTPEVKTREPLALLRGRGIDAVHAVELPPALLRTRDIAALKRLVFEENDGFWLGDDGGPGAGAGGGGGGGAGTRLPVDSVARLVRRLAH